MFGPNVTHGIEKAQYFHHREACFQELLSELDKSFRDAFPCSGYDYLFITGSGTTANEIVIASFKYEFVTLHPKNEFGNRMRLMNTLWSDGKELFTNSDMTPVCYPLYETSVSEKHETHWNLNRVFLFLDMVSAFPYYMPPVGTQVWTTVSSKQLGAWPVLGIIAVKSGLDLDRWFRNLEGSGLNLKRHSKFQWEKNETMTTPAMPLYYSLWKELQTFDVDKFKKKIDGRRTMIHDLIGSEHIIGTGPVVTLTKNYEWADYLCERFNLYRNSGNFQIFLWSGTDDDYDQLYHFLRDKKNGGKRQV